MTDIADAATVARPAHPKTARELLLGMYLAGTTDQADDQLARFSERGFELAPKQALDAEQRARAEALRTARGLVEGRTPLSTAALTPVQTSELVPLARFILTGSEFEQDVRLEVAQERAAREAAERDPGPLGACMHDDEHDDQGDVADVTRTPEALRKAMQTAAAARP